MAQGLKPGLRNWLMHYRSWRVLFFFTTAFVLYLATLKGPYPIPSASSDKVNHLCAFLVLTLLMCLGFPRTRPRLCALWMLAYGCLIEVIQSFLPWSDCSLFDVAADASGILIALLCLQALIRTGLWQNAASAPRGERI